MSSFECSARSSVSLERIFLIVSAELLQIKLNCSFSLAKNSVQKDFPCIWSGASFSSGQADPTAIPETAPRQVLNHIDAASSCRLGRRT
jgi:hypothetical protein